MKDKKTGKHLVVPGRIEDFITAWNGSESGKEAAKEYGCTYGSARTYAATLRSLGYYMKSFRMTPRISHADVAAASKGCTSLEEVAENLGVGRAKASHLRSRARAAGFAIKPLHQGGQRKMDWKDVIQRWEGGSTAKEIASVYGTNPGSVHILLLNLRKNGVDLSPHGKQKRKRYRAKPKGEFKELADFVKSVRGDLT